VKVFLDTNVWLSATVFSGLCEAILLECHQREWLLTTPLVQQEAHAVLLRKFPHVPQALALFESICVWQPSRRMWLNPPMTLMHGWCERHRRLGQGYLSPEIGACWDGADKVTCSCSAHEMLGGTCLQNTAVFEEFSALHFKSWASRYGA
jgi:hypothetical protein